MTDIVERHIRPDIADRRVEPIDMVQFVDRNTEPDLAASYFIGGGVGQVEVRKVGSADPVPWS